MMTMPRQLRMAYPGAIFRAPLVAEFEPSLRLENQSVRGTLGTE